MELNNQINLTYLEATFGNNKSIINKVLNSFLSKTPQLLIDLTDNANNNNWDEVKMIAHKTKSSFNTIGATTIGDILAQIELEAGNENEDNIHILINKVENLKQHVFNEIEKEINK